MTPSVKEALKSKRRAEEYKVEEQGKASKAYSEEMDVRSKVAEHKKAKAQAQTKQAQQGEGDRAGVKVGPIAIPFRLAWPMTLVGGSGLTVVAPRLHHQPTSNPPDTTR